MASDSDLAAAVTIALVILAIALCVWPGFARARARGLAGYWADKEGGLYEVRAGSGDRAFVVLGAGPSPAGPRTWQGRITGLRGLRLSNQKKGGLDLGGRRISWKGGGAWTRQGVR